MFTAGYGDLTPKNPDEILTIAAGNSFDLSIVQSNNWSMTVVWVDWNADGAFDGIGEMVVDWNDGGGTLPSRIEVTVPQDVVIVKRTLGF